MGQVPIKIGERSYRLSCGEGEEARLAALSDYINAKLVELSAQHGHIGEERLLVMAMLMITDELFDARDQTAATAGSDAPGRDDAHSDDAGEAA